VVLGLLFVDLSLQIVSAKVYSLQVMELELEQVLVQVPELELVQKIPIHQFH
jgi:hypothetical protein